MKVMKFEYGTDFDLLEAFLRNQYFEHCRAVSWLPERLHDLVYRVSAQEMVCMFFL